MRLRALGPEERMRQAANERAARADAALRGADDGGGGGGGGGGRRPSRFADMMAQAARKQQGGGDREAMELMSDMFGEQKFAFDPDDDPDDEPPPRGAEDG